MSRVQQFIRVRIAPLLCPLLDHLERQQVESNLPDQEYFNIARLRCQALLMRVQVMLDGFSFEQIIANSKIKDPLFGLS